MIAIDGVLYEENTPLPDIDHAFCSGDVLFETMRCRPGNLTFLEEHYLNLMASMRILRMDIPMNYTLEYFSDLLKRTLEANGHSNSPALAKFIVYRGSKDDIHLALQTSELEEFQYTHSNAPCKAVLFKEHRLAPGLITNLNTNMRQVYALGQRFALENDFDIAFLLNTDNKVVGTSLGPIFIYANNKIKTTPLDDGSVRSVFRDKVLSIVNSFEQLEVVEGSILPFELQKADEIFTGKIHNGLRSVTSYRKAEYQTALAKKITEELNVVWERG